MSTTVATRGFQAENVVRTQIKGKYSIPGLPTTKQLLTLANKYAPNRVKKAFEAQAKEGISLLDLSSWDIVDIVYGLDFIIKVDGVFVGIDVTINTDMHKIQSKRRKLKDLQSLYRAIGIERTILFNPNLETLDKALA